MHEEYYGFVEKPFSLTPDPKYLYKSESHANAFDLLQYAIRRREGFVVVTGDIGTGKTTLCRAILEQLDRKTFTALVLNPFLSEEDLLRLILQDFGVVSRAEIKRGRLAGVSKQELIETLNEFLLSLLPLRAGALLIIDEAQNLPLQVLEQIRILSNLETDKEKLLQIVLVGQLNLKDLLRSPGLRQLDQRVSIRYELKPLTREETSAYVAHRLTIAGGGAAVSFSPKALDLVHRYTSGIPRLINLVCDRALLGGYSARTNRITPEMVGAAATRPRSRDAGALDVRMAAPGGGCVCRRRRIDGSRVAGGRVCRDSASIARRVGHDRSAASDPDRGTGRRARGSGPFAGACSGSARVSGNRGGGRPRGGGPRDGGPRTREGAGRPTRADARFAPAAGGGTSNRRGAGWQVFSDRRIVPSECGGGRARGSVAGAGIPRASGTRRIGRSRHVAPGPGRSLRPSRAGAAG